MNNSINASDLSTVTDKFSNVVFEDQRLPISQSVLTNQSLDSSLAYTHSISESNWTLQDILNRPINLGTFPWNITDSPLTTLASFVLPHDIFTPSLVSQIISMMTYLRTGFEITIQINGTKFHQGRLIAVWFPQSFTNSGTIINNQYLTNNAHVKAAADTSESVVLTIPYAATTAAWSRFNLNQGDLFGNLNIYVLNQLYTGTGSSPGINFTVYLRMINPQINVPVDPSAISSYFGSHNLNKSSLINSKPLPTDHKYYPNENVIIEPQGGLSDAAGAIGSAASTAMALETGNPIAAITSGLSTVEKTVSAISNITAGNFDKPNEAQFPSPFIRRIINNPSLGVGQDSIAEHNLYPFSSHSVPLNYLSSDQDDMFLKELQKRPCLFETVDWDETDTSGTFLYEIPICPTYFFTGDPSRIKHSWTSFIGQLFCLWRGSIKLKLEFVGSQFHSGRILVAIIPHQVAFNQVASTIESETQSPYVVWDIKESHELIIDTPWNVNVPFLNSPTTNTINTSTDFLALTVDQSASCQVRLRVLNELAGPVGAMNSAQINIWVSSDGVEYSRLRGPYDTQLYQLYDVLTPGGSFDNDAIVEPQSGDNTGVNMQRDETISSEAPDMMLNKIPEIPNPYFLGEQFNHFKDLLRRSVDMIGSISLPTTPVGQVGVIQIPVMPSVGPLLMSLTAPPGNTLLTYSPSWLAAISQCYCFWSGKLNFKIIIEQNSNSTPIYFQTIYQPDKYVDVNTFTTGTFLQALVVNGYANDYSVSFIQPAIEVSIPWSQPNPVALTNYSGQAITPFATPVPASNYALQQYSNGTLQIHYCTQGGSTSSTMKIYMSVGDDFQLYYPTSPPMMMLGPGTPPSETQKYVGKKKGQN